MKKKILIMTIILLAVLSWGIPGTRTVQAASRYIIYVNRTSNIVNVVRRKTRKVVRSMYCSTGRGYGTPAGTFYLGQKYRWHSLYQGHYGQYCTRITGHVLFHSVPANAYSAKAVPTIAFNQLGTQASMGCVRLACGDAYWIYRHCPSGTKVVIGERKKLKKPKYSRIRMSTKRKFNWDPTDPSKANPYRPVLKKSAKGKEEIPFGSAVNIKDLVKVKSPVTSTRLLRKNISSKGKINTKKPGKYKVKVKVRDPRSGLSRTKTFTFVVGKEKPKTVQNSTEIPEVETDAQPGKAFEVQAAAQAGTTPEVQAAAQAGTTPEVQAAAQAGAPTEVQASTQEEKTPEVSTTVEADKKTAAVTKVKPSEKPAKKKVKKPAKKNKKTDKKKKNKKKPKNKDKKGKKKNKKKSKKKPVKKDKKKNKKKSAKKEKKKGKKKNG